MVELRWAVPEHTTTKAPRLQYRQLPSVVSIGGPGWSEWQDVPFVVVPGDPQRPVSAGDIARSFNEWTSVPPSANAGEVSE